MKPGGRAAIGSSTAPAGARVGCLMVGEPAAGAGGRAFVGRSRPVGLKSIGRAPKTGASVKGLLGVSDESGGAPREGGGGSTVVRLGSVIAGSPFLQI